MSEEREKPEEAIEEEAVEEVSGGVEVEDMLLEEAEKDVNAYTESPRDVNVLEDEVIAEFYRFKRSCEALEELLRTYVPELFEEEGSLTEIDMKTAMKIASRMLGLQNGAREEELLEGEPSEFAQMLFRKVLQRLVDCRWFKAMLRGKRPITPSQLKFDKVPEELKQLKGVEI